MNKISEWIVKKRWLILVVATLLLVPSAFGYIHTKVNYDILTYLPDTDESRIGQDFLDQDFNMATTTMITVENLSVYQTESLKQDILAIDGVKDVLWSDQLLDQTIPSTMLPEDIRSFFYNHEGATMMMVTFEEEGTSERTMQAIKDIKSVLREDCFIGGMSAITVDMQELFDSEIIYYILIAVALVMIVLLLGMESWLAPVIFMISIVYPIVYNYGTNIFLGEISFITKALATVLQLGVTMDFSIFLLHRYQEEKELTKTREEAMARAISHTFASIAGSSTTTIAGFLAMCMMSLTLGKDIGLVMAKGVFLGVICTVTILPSLLMAFDRVIEKYYHRPILPSFNKMGDFVVKHYLAIFIVFLVLMVPFGLAQRKVDVYYTLFDAMPEDLVAIQGTNRLKDDFNMTTTHFILVDKDLSSQNKADLIQQIEQLDGINQVLGYEKFFGSMLPAAILPNQLTDIFESDRYSLILANSSYKAGSDLQNEQLNKMSQIVKQYDANGLIAGEGAMTKDLIETADVDFSNVSVTSILAVFVIIMIVFKSFLIPILLVASIEAAIAINMGMSYFSGACLPFIASIVVGTIQLGATVDYAILMTTRFREERRLGKDAKEACRLALVNSAPSIVTSALAFFAATVGVALVSKIELIQSLCALLARGALISMVVILCVLPAILIIFNKAIEKTSKDWLKGEMNHESI